MASPFIIRFYMKKQKCLNKRRCNGRILNGLKIEIFLRDKDIVFHYTKMFRWKWKIEIKNALSDEYCIIYCHIFFDIENFYNDKCIFSPYLMFTNFYFQICSPPSFLSLLLWEISRKLVESVSKFDWDMSSLVLMVE